MSAHTPGPWTMKQASFAFHIYGVFKKSKNAFITCAYWSNEAYGASKQEAEANARLIAAAPELLEALQAIIVDGVHSDVVPHLHRKAVAAIAKATGSTA